MGEMTVMAKSNMRGHEVFYDGVDWRYTDTNELLDFRNRPCANCGYPPTEDGDDYCLQHLGNVVNACCGHGSHKGYIQFDNGITVRGYFEIERKSNKTEESLES